MKKNFLKSLLCAVFCGFYAINATAATSLFSDYGQIQNVQHYSTNPFWTPNSPYNQRMPQPVYVQGADLTAEDCFKVVQSLVSVQCMARDNCKNTTLSDIRPTIMVQLSNLPGNNYVSACSGYIDGVFESYVAQYGNTLPNRAVAFPAGTTLNQNLNDNDVIQIENPYKQVPAKWQMEIKERSDELQQLQKQNGAGSEHLSATAFPTTFEDLSFSERMAVKAEGYEPYKGASAYVIPDFVNKTEWCNGAGSGSPECSDKTQNLNSSNNSSNSNVQLTADEQKLLEAIINVLNPQNSEERFFFTGLATDYIKKEDKDASLMLDNNFVYNFLAESDNLQKYKPGLTSPTLTGTVENADLKIDLDWDEILIQVSTVLDASLRKRGALVCENNRSYQVGIDTAMWVGTIAAAIASFGTGGVAAAGGRAALGAGLKALATGVSKVGLKTAGKNISKAGSKQLAKAAVKIGLKNNMRGWAQYTGKGLTKKIAKKAGENFATKRGLILASIAAGGTIYETIGRNSIANNSSTIQEDYSKNAAGVLYSLVESGVSKDYINCQDVDYGEGCYAVCGHDQPDDDLNTKVFKPILGRNYCVNEKDFTLYDMENGTPLMMNNDDYIKVTQKIRSEIADKGKMKDTLGSITNQKNARHGCDWNEDDIDMYFGSYLYDPDTMEPSTSMIIEEVIRIDD